MPRCKHTLIGRVDPETGEIRPTDGRRRKNSPYQKSEPTEADAIMERIKGLKDGEQRKEIIRLELELKEAKKKSMPFCSGCSMK